MKRVFLIVALLALFAVSAQAQYVDRIVRPCSAGATALASVIVNPNNSNNVVVTSCVGGQLIVNGSPVIPNGLPDPGSNGIVVRTAANTTVARTMTGSGGITVANGSGVGAAPDVSITNVLTAGSCTSCSLTYNAKGQVTVAASGTSSAITALTGDGTATGPGSVPLTLASVVSAGSCTACNLTVDAKGRVTAKASGSAGITNSAGANVVPKSNGTNLVASQITDDGATVTMASSNIFDNTGNVQLSNGGSAAGLSLTAATSQAVIGDWNGQGNNTTLTVDDGAQRLTFAGGVDFLLSGSSVQQTGTVLPNTAGVPSVGSVALPYASFILGNAANNSAQLTGTFTGNRVATFPDKTGTVAFVISGTSGSIGGGVLTAGSCASGTAAVTGSLTSMTVSISPNTYPGDGSTWFGYVSTNGTVTVKVCAIIALTPTASTYNIRVIQ